MTELGKFVMQSIFEENSQQQYWRMTITRPDIFREKLSFVVWLKVQPIYDQCDMWSDN